MGFSEQPKFNFFFFWPFFSPVDQHVPGLVHHVLLLHLPHDPLDALAEPGDAGDGITEQQKAAIARNVYADAKDNGDGDGVVVADADAKDDGAGEGGAATS